MIRLTISDANCLLLISVKCERERDRFTIVKEKERKRKNIIVIANPIISFLMKIFLLFADIQNQSTIEEKKTSILNIFNDHQIERKTTDIFY
jgi:hypothetical protein